MVCAVLVLGDLHKCFPLSSLPKEGGDYCYLLHIFCWCCSHGSSSGLCPASSEVPARYCYGVSSVINLPAGALVQSEKRVAVVFCQLATHTSCLPKLSFCPENIALPLLYTPNTIVVLVLSTVAL